jgi:hypothetical protein
MGFNVVVVDGGARCAMTALALSRHSKVRTREVKIKNLLFMEIISFVVSGC